ncbi:MAG TPA: hypothetical protein VF092_17110 [Longimicrobium sp.]
MWQDVLMVFSVLTGTALAILSIYSVWRLHRAEAKLIDRLKADRELSRELHPTGLLEPSERELEAIHRAVLRNLRTLRPDERRDLRQVIQQPSETGRKNYLAKLFESVSTGLASDAA